MSEASRLKAFLLALDTSPSARRRYDKRPEAEMKRFDLSPRTIKAVLSGNVIELWQAVVGPLALVGHVIVVPKTHRPWRRKRTRVARKV